MGISQKAVQTCYHNYLSRTMRVSLGFEANSFGKCEEFIWPVCAWDRREISCELTFILNCSEFTLHGGVFEFQTWQQDC